MNEHVALTFYKEIWLNRETSLVVSKVNTTFEDTPKHCKAVNNVKVKFQSSFSKDFTKNFSLLCGFPE